MGYLLKEVLKTLCGVNQWSYAVFWKIGCQNTKLLIWEESYYETPTISGDWSEVQNFQLLNRLHLLVNKTMMENQFTLVGKGLIGRAAVTGNHQWILSKGLSGDAHPPEVLNELSQQFLAGIQTISVIPVLPHGVVQFGSYLHIMENMGFVEGVRMLISQLGCVPGVLLSDENATKEPALNAAASVYYGNSIQTDGYIGQTSSFQTSNVTQSFAISPEVYPHNSQLPNNMIKAEVIPPTPPNLWTKQQASLHVPKPPFSHESSIGSIMLDNGLIEQQVSGENNLVKANLDVFRESHPKADHVLMSNSHENTVFPPIGVTELIASSELRESSSINVVNHKQSLDGEGAGFFLDGNKGMVENDLFQALSIMLTQNEQQPSSSEYISDVYEVQNPAVGDAKYEGVYAQHEPGDDLMDVLGADLKNRLLNGSSSLNNELSSGPKIKNISASTISNSDSDMFSMSGFDRILDNMVSNRCSKQSQEDNVSCRTTLTNLSGSSAANCSSSYSRAGVSGQIQNELFGPLSKSGAVSSCSFKSECSKESAGIYSRGSSIYGSSQISSWVESGYDTKPSSSVSTGYSKKPDETTKTGRKRLKPGENPRPRPKDRQMIQDRVKELREIVPNGAKCSIDALLERTIKHMLFLQSVTKHADKLKQTGESKIISKEGGLLLKDNNEGGATWAYEVGSQSMVCPIIVEDLNHPRQMLVEMLCEERGLFLEIADIIRGLGLTILKGVMETRNDKIWARFAVEANRDVTRMEIFISLVRLLEQTAKGGNDPANADTAMAHSFHQAATIPATGRPCSLL